MTTPWHREAAETLRLGMPIAATQLLMMGLHISDMIIVARLGVFPLAAAGLAAACLAFLSFFCGGVMSSVAPLIAQARGAQDEAAMAAAFGQGVLLAFLITAPIVALLGYVEPILLAFGQERGLSAAAGEYLGIKRWYLPLFISMNAMRGLFATLGRPGIPVRFIGTAFVINVALSWYLVHEQALGLPGAAWATIISGLLIWSGMVAYLKTRAPFAGIVAQIRWRIDLPVLKQLLAVGLPSGITNAAELGLFSAAAMMMGWIGPLALAAHEIALQAAALSFMVAFGIAQAGSIRVGLAMGREDLVAARHAGFVALHLTVIFMACTGLLFWLAPARIIGLFLDPAQADTQAVIAIGSGLLAIAAAFQIFDGAQVTAASILRGMRDSKIPMMIAMAGYWLVGMPIAYGAGFILKMGGTGIWIGLASGLAVVALALIWRFERRSGCS